MKAMTGLFILLVAALPAQAQQPAKEKSVDYYPIKVGTKWEYSVDTGNGQKVKILNEIAKIETIDGKAMALLETKLNGEVQATEHVGTDAGGIFRYRFKGIEVTPPVCLLKYPVKEGTTWETETKIGGQQLTVSGREGAKEKIDVPAGKYDAIPAKIETTVNGNKISNTYWFTADVGIIKQSVEIGGRSIVMELTKFEGGK